MRLEPCKVCGLSIHFVCSESYATKKSIALEAENKIYRDTLESIAKNTCCDKCQEASLWAKEALAKTKEKNELRD